MFIKPYRKPLSRLSQQNKEIYFDLDLKNAPAFLKESLTECFSNQKIRPVLNGAMSFSFRYSDSDTYLIRDIGHATLLIKYFLDSKFKEGFQSYLNHHIKELSAIDKFLNNRSESIFDGMYQGKSTYFKSIVVNLKPNTTNTNDIDSIEVFYDSDPDIYVVSQSEQNTNTDVKNRIGISFKIYLNQNKSSYEKNIERLSCVNTVQHFMKLVDCLPLSDVSHILNSVEHRFEFYHNNFEDSLISMLISHKEQVFERFEQSCIDIDKETIKLIKMMII